MIDRLKDKPCLCCSDGCISNDLYVKLSAAQLIIGEEICINSGYRCHEHNEAVGGSPNSSHMKGLAVDVNVKNDFHRSKLIEAFIRVGITRIGVYEKIIHCDIDPDKEQNKIWVG